MEGLLPASLEPRAPHPRLFIGFKTCNSSVPAITTPILKDLYITTSDNIHNPSRQTFLCTYRQPKESLFTQSQLLSMTGRGGGGHGGGRGKVLLPPINFIFKLLQQRSTVSIWLYEQLAIRIEGKIRVR